MQASVSREEAMLSQNNTGVPAIAERTAAAPAVIPQDTILKRQFFVRMWWSLPPQVKLSVS